MKTWTCTFLKLAYLVAFHDPKNMNINELTADFYSQENILNTRKFEMHALLKVLYTSIFYSFHFQLQTSGTYDLCFPQTPQVHPATSQGLALSEKLITVNFWYLRRHFSPWILSFKISLHHKFKISLIRWSANIKKLICAGLVGTEDIVSLFPNRIFIWDKCICSYSNSTISC